MDNKWTWHTEGERAFVLDEEGFTVCEIGTPANNNRADIAKSIVDDHNKAMNPPAQQPEAQAVARLVIVDRGGGFKAIRTWDDIGDLPPGEHFLFSATHPTTPPAEPSSEGVTDEMVERIGNAHGVRSYTCDASGRNVQHTAWRFTRDELKAALEAALATKPAKE